MFIRIFFILTSVILSNLSALEVNTNIRLLIKMPTRNRVEKFFLALDSYYSNLSNKISYHFLISCDKDDTAMNSPEVLKRLKNYPNLTICFGDNTSKIEACNADIEKFLDFDILLLASDDMIPVVRGYDYLISCAYDIYFPNLDGVLHFNDGHTKDELVTLPILGKKYYDHFGYVYYPEYNTSHCDNEMTIVAQRLNRLVYIDLVLIEHKHPAWGTAKRDELYEINDIHFWDDKEVFMQRELRNFDIKPF